MLDHLRKMLDESAARRKADAQRFKGHDEQLCMLCWAYGADKRSLFVSCFYAVHEAVPEAIDLSECEPKFKDRGYYLRLCKSCRGAFLGHMREWANKCRSLRDTPKDHDGNVDSDNPEANIPVRIDGAVVMLTREQWDKRQGQRAGDSRE